MQETAFFINPESGFRIDYSPVALEQIRKRAKDGLMALPRIGMGVGGLLLGVRENGRIRLLDSVEIPCSHAGGPSFTLTGDEKESSRHMVAETRGAIGLPVVIGWYCSKTRGDGTLNEADLAFHRELFPDPWQVAMVMRPSAADRMRAAFFFRDENAEVVKGLECEVDEWRPLQEPELEGLEAEPRNEVENPDAPAPVFIEAPKTSATPKVAETRLSDLLAFPDVLEAAARTPASATKRAADLFGVTPLAPSPRPRSRTRVLPLSVAILAIAAAAVAYLTQDSWRSKPPLDLNSSVVNGSLLIRWNAEALRGVDHASMYVNDGGKLETVNLDRLQLNSGMLKYSPKSQRVTAKLDAGETSAITGWFAPAAPSTTALEDPSIEKQ